jgi:murein DD-endopeptidase MepM/ murein hydrolase activator NlpD
VIAHRVCGKHLAAVVMSILIATGLPSRAGAASDSSDAIARQRSLLSASRNRLDQKRRLLDFEELRERDLQRQQHETSTSIAVVEGHLRGLEQRIQAATDAEARARQHLAAAQSELDRQRHAYEHRIVQMYERPVDGTLAVLVGATSFIDLTERWHDLRLIVREDQREIVARQRVLRQVEAARAALSAIVSSLEAERLTQGQERSQLAALGQQRSDLVVLAATHRASVAREVQYLEDLTAEEETQLENLLREQEAALERQRQAGRAPTPRTPSLGGMQWPLTGPITSPFGTRLNPFGGGKSEFHPGIDIAVDVGTTVAAAATGRVLIAGWVSGYGNYVAVDHGNGLSTGYGHLSQIFVSVGQDVQRGQALGASGNTGRSTGPHLIFEVRRNGTPVDPTPYLP